MPARSAITDDQLRSELAELFRTVGYDGASLELISGATSLRKSSLYHRFRGGKEEMADEVVGYALESFANQVLGPVAEQGPLSERIDRIAAGIDHFYDGGTKACLIDTLSFGSVGDRTADRLRDGAAAWIAAFASLARESGASPAVARERAEDAVARIEGALVLARATGSTTAFKRAVTQLDALLTGA